MTRGVARGIAGAGVAAAMMLAGAAVIGWAPRQGAPPRTLLYQNFPNPFPTPAATFTCIWFDLRATGPVQLDIYDIRGTPIRRVFPIDRSGGVLPAGRFGRPTSSGGPCDGQFIWDGRTSTGATVPPGVYLLRLRADGEDQIKKMVFRGR